MSILSTVSNPAKLQQLNIAQLSDLSGEIREKIIQTINSNGGHLASNLGIVETTVALYKVFNFPKDKLIFDVGHQCYAHKLLSGRADRFDTIRTANGLSGFPDREESEYDCFTEGHAGTSLSQALGLCEGRDKLGDDYCVIAVVGDGSFVNGLNMEALTSSEEKPKNLIVILNDNEMSISRNKNGLYKFISKGTTKKSYLKGKNAFKKIFKNSFITKFLRKIRNFIKRVFNKNNYFEKFGFKYVGVIDGNNIAETVKMLMRVKETAKHRAVFLHVKTTKGKGHDKAEENATEYHGVGKDMKTSKCLFSLALGEKLCSVMQENKKVVAITSGMKDGTGLTDVATLFPNNVIDVGIAEEYAVTFSAGLAASGIRPIVCVYSTFLQRAYDQILHDVCLQNLPVVFCIDRAGLVGEDGQTHQGVFDLSYLSHLPNLTVLAPSSRSELSDMIDYALSVNGPVAIRYPNEKAYEYAESKKFIKPDWTVVSEGDSLSILAVGPRMISLANSVAKKFNGKVKVINARSIKPLDCEMLDEIKDMPIITLEENVKAGGFGASVIGFYADKEIQAKVKPLGVQDQFVKHASVKEQLEENGLDEQTVSKMVEEMIKEGKAYEKKQ